MPTISASTQITIPTGQRVVINGANARGTVTVSPGSMGQIYDFSGGQEILGPFAKATTLDFQITSGAVVYNFGTDGDSVIQVTRDAFGSPLRLVDQQSGEAIPSDALLSVPVLTPVGFRWTGHPLTLRRTASGIVTDFAITDYIPAVTNIWYVDPVSGVDGTAVVNNRALPLKNLATALAKTDVDQIRIINVTGDFFARTSASWNNIQPTRNVSIVVESGRFVSIACASATLPTWAVNGTYSNVYSTTVTSANSTGITDLSARIAHPGSYALTNKAAEVFNNVARPFRTLKKVASLAAVAAEAGTWFHDGTQSHVRAHDDRNLVGDQFMQPTNNTNNGRFPAASNDRTIYVQGVDFVGGRPFYATVAESAAITGCVAVFNDCTFQGSGLANGLGIEFDITAYLYRCGGFYNWNDGFNYHCPTAPAALGAATSPDVIEIECLAYGNGTTGSSAASDNASTAHEFSNVIRLNCVYPDSADRVLVDIDSVHSWSLACVVGQASTVAAGKECVAALNSARMWLDSAYVFDGANTKFASDSAAILRHYNSGTVNNTAGYTGTIRSYLG